jgi:fido (protein-threonine AMPylation protein)
VPGLDRTADEKRQLEVRNGAIQFLAVLHYSEEWTSGVSQLTPDLLCEFQRLAINQIYDCAGKFRDGPVKIAGVKHEPPAAIEVRGLVNAMCDYINQNWHKAPIHLAAYLMWRVNWIHPFWRKRPHGESDRVPGAMRTARL